MTTAAGRAGADSATPANGLVYDTGALVAAERGDRDLWTMHKAALAMDATILVPTVVYAQAWRGGRRSANIGRLVKACTLRDLDPETARRAGELCGAAGTDDIVDATVVTTAKRAGAVVVTSDPGDISKLAGATNLRLEIRIV
ncbi:PIN domain-containing protein [Actinoplanes oblitus]|uniref:PIN domain-containing protein n=1 Tax=Actinoplanes oblitus TaxID=3040509 RepID=A0ABY8WL52_9ACTN|nr:PIN domain-containing protein [Actinoplanes oblitus]WIM98378.1 PIN domain-containing protein [Actinoplanes oblitus]